MARHQPMARIALSEPGAHETSRSNDAAPWRLFAAAYSSEEPIVGPRVLALLSRPKSNKGNSP